MTEIDSGVDYDTDLETDLDAGLDPDVDGDQGWLADDGEYDPQAIARAAAEADPGDFGNYVDEEQLEVAGQAIAAVFDQAGENLGSFDRETAAEATGQAIEALTAAGVVLNEENITAALQFGAGQAAMHDRGAHTAVKLIAAESARVGGQLDPVQVYGLAEQILAEQDGPYDGQAAANAIRAAADQLGDGVPRQLTNRELVNYYGTRADAIRGQNAGHPGDAAGGSDNHSVAQKYGRRAQALRRG